MTTELVHETDKSRYVMKVDGDIVAIAQYRIDDDSISFTSTFTPPEHRGNGYAAQIVQFAIDDVDKNSSKRVVPVCWYVSDWFEARPERAGLLTR